MTTQPPRPVRFDRTLRVVMWSDAFLSVAIVVVSIVATPVLATIGVPRSALWALGLTTGVCAVLLAAFGAVTAVVLMVRMSRGETRLPVRLRLPLPAPMRPPMECPEITARSRMSS